MVETVTVDSNEVVADATVFAQKLDPDADAWYFDYLMGLLEDKLGELNVHDDSEKEAAKARAFCPPNQLRATP